MKWLQTPYFQFSKKTMSCFQHIRILRFLLCIPVLLMLSFNSTDVSVQFSERPENESSANTSFNTIIPFPVSHSSAKNAGHRSMKLLNLSQYNKDRNISSSSLRNSFIRMQAAAAGISKFSECSNAIRGIYFIDIKKEIPEYISTITRLNFKEISASPD